jgi:thiamine transport system substrate-binding protein
MRSTPGGVTAVLALSLLAGCSVAGGPEEEGDPAKRVVVATHDSWSMPKKVLREFTEKTGYVVQVKPSGDAGALTNKLVLTKNSPIADMVYGIDNTFLTRAVDEGVLEAYDPAGDAGDRHEPRAERLDAVVTPVDFSDVCVNVDDTWFAEHDLTPPQTFEDLVDTDYRGLFVLPAPTTSSPGLAFLVATVARFGEDGWRDYWADLYGNDVKLTAGWSDAYQVDFTAGGGDGDRPVVLSYASSPPFTVPEGGGDPTTSALLDTCSRQVEYAGLLAGAENPDGAQAFIDFMVGKRFQRALPESMYVYPVDDTIQLPESWAAHAPTAQRTWDIPAEDIGEHRADWLRAWEDIRS